MFATTLWILLALGVSIALISAVADDRWLLTAAGVSFLLIGVLVASTGLQLEDGVNIEKKQWVNADNETITNINETRVYRNLNEGYDFVLSEFVGVLFIGAGLYGVLRGVAGRGGPEAVPFR